jgi:hypothetical protein
MKTLRLLLLIGATLNSIVGQNTAGALRGVITDQSGAVIPKTEIRLTDATGSMRKVEASAVGEYRISDLAPGKYIVEIRSPGFAGYQNPNVLIVTGVTLDLNVTLTVTLEKQEVTVAGDGGGSVSVDPQTNVGALVLREQDLEALPDDPDELAAELQALAGPSAGPKGGEIFVDGFTSGSLPPKASIREVRINQNPFSSEYDKIGFGRIEILTKPGTDRFRGQGFFNFTDGVLNARNPYAENRPPSQTRLFGGNLSGPISKRSSFFADFERREIDDNSVINATILDPALDVVPFSEAVATPQRRTVFTPRVDYQLNTNNTLVARYSYTRMERENAGIGEFSLLSRAYDTSQTEHLLQLTETAVLNARAINETRFAFSRSQSDDFGDNGIAAIQVLDAFTGGGSQVGRSSNQQDRWELHNSTSLALGAHGVKFGIRLRGVQLRDISPRNFGGTFTFAGGPAPVLDATFEPIRDASGNLVLAPITSIERYRRTLSMQALGMTSAEIRQLGGGATQFSISAGDPLASVRQVDFSGFVQDDWRVRPNFTLSLGLRYETQTNVSDWTNFAPRLSLAWAPGARGGRQGKTVIRGGFGIFYDRVGESLVLQARRFDGQTQSEYIVRNPDFFPFVPSLDSLEAQQAPLTIRTLASDLRAPYTMQAAIGVERQLTSILTVASNYIWARAVHLLRSRNLNAPLPGSISLSNPLGIRPYGEENLYAYESSGLFEQKQWMTNFNLRLRSSVSLFGFYVLGKAESDTDSPEGFPANPYDLSSEWGRSALDVRHRVVVGGSIVTRLGLRLSPMVMIRSGSPFNITTGQDDNGDLIFADRPAFATDLNKPGVIVTRYGAFDPNPAPGEAIIPRNYGSGPGFFSVNLRVSKTFGFGQQAEARLPEPGSEPGGGGMRQGSGGGRGGPGRGSMGAGRGVMGGIFGDSSTSKRYNLTLSVSARNLLNHTNPGPSVPT